ncbi:MAG: polysaccharide deacetylase family protein [Xanthobacteraceae bacterium]|uniref:polysaccharide deacetylase family protein n=1 Tax=Pseudolabrys sp. TaxID=1960880 RepID=UPI003D119AE4
MRYKRHTALLAALIGGMAAAHAHAEPASCPGNPDAIGVSRIISVGAADHARLGLMQYRTSLPLNDREVVLTFDDGPLPPYTDRVLAILARHCVKATFFLVGRHAAANPAAALRVAEAGHTIGNHSQNHSLHFASMSEARAEKEIEAGNRTLDAILGHHVAPFFRIPGLGRTRAVERYAEAKSLVVWSADAVADDWTRITSQQVLSRALSRLEARGKGILLLHDIQPRTVLMLPALLAELKRRHFRIVHVVPEAVGPAAPSPLLLARRHAPKLGWPRVVSAAPVFSMNRLTLPPVSPLPQLELAAAEPESLQTLARATAIRALRLAGGAPPDTEASLMSPLRVAANGAPRVTGSVPMPPDRHRAAAHAVAARSHGKPEQTVATVAFSRPDMMP